MRILLADDERPARAELRYMLEQLTSQAVFYEAETGQAVLDLLETTPVDVVFLDINMPGKSGLAAAATLIERPNPPLIVFATAYDVHAVRAFELAAVDYIVKPFSDARLARTMVRLRTQLDRDGERGDPVKPVRAYLEHAGQQLNKLWAERDNQHGVLIGFDDIRWIEAEGKQVRVHTAQEEILTLRQNLKELEARLAPHRIVRTHKAYLVNLDWIDEIVPWFSSTYILRMKDPAATELPLSRQYAKALKALLA